MQIGYACASDGQFAIYYYYSTAASSTTDDKTYCKHLCSNPTLIITGTYDNNVPTANSLIIAGKIPGAWLVQLKDAGHALFLQYPDEINRDYKHFFRPQQTLVDENII